MVELGKVMVRNVRNILTIKYQMIKINFSVLKLKLCHKTKQRQNGFKIFSIFQDMDKNFKWFKQFQNSISKV